MFFKSHIFLLLSWSMKYGDLYLKSIHHFSQDHSWVSGSCFNTNFWNIWGFIWFFSVTKEESKDLQHQFFTNALLPTEAYICLQCMSTLHHLPKFDLELELNVMIVSVL